MSPAKQAVVALLWSVGGSILTANVSKDRPDALEMSGKVCREITLGEGESYDRSQQAGAGRGGAEG